MQPDNQLYELLQEYQRELRAEARRAQLARQATEKEHRTSRPLLGWLGFLLITLGNRMQAAPERAALPEPRRTPCPDA